MPAPAVPLEDLAQRIAQQETELERLRREYGARQEQLTTLTRRREELAAQLRQVEAEISACTQGSTRQPVPSSPKLVATPPKAPVSKDQAATPSSLADLIVTRLREAKGQPLGVRHLTEEATRLGFTTGSSNPYELVKYRVRELLKKGFLRKAPNRAGVLLAKEKKQPAAADGKATVAPKSSQAQVRKGAVVPQAAPSSRAGKSKEPGSLREVLIHLLRESKQPLAASKLAQQALASGYRTGSKHFTKVVQVALGKMKEVERAPQGGWRLKKGKG